MNNRLRGHQLMTSAILRALPPLAATDGQDYAAVAQVKYFTPDSGWYWYATEFDGLDTLYGLVFGPHVEFGVFSLAELEAMRGPQGLPVERDLYFRPTTLETIIGTHRQDEGEIRHHAI